MNIQTFFKLGMKRDLTQLIDPFEGNIVNLGSGNSPMPLATNLDLPYWDAETDRLPFGDECIDHVFAFHFFEHLPATRIIYQLRECERVLRDGGTLNVVVPHRLGSMAYHDLDHKVFFCEDTWKTLFGTPYYDKGRELPWRFHIHFNVIIGIVERNLCLMTQLMKRPWQ